MQPGQRPARRRSAGLAAVAVGVAEQAGHRPPARYHGDVEQRRAYHHEHPAAAGQPDLYGAAGADHLLVADGTLLPAGPLAGVRAVLAGYDPATPATRSAPHPVAGAAGTLEAVVVPSAVGPHVVLLRPCPGDPQRLAALGLTPRQCQVTAEFGR
ncbi:hypothetical protein [Micromonospora sp. LOL_021]|uniref:hypothetical protein n=1 Tax=Micromonospora sp. LOL_021 TaxID=3345417 RepID=UPI003A8A23CE